MQHRWITTALVALSPSWSAATSVQGDWTFPQSPDETSILNSGATYKIAWTSNLQSWFSQYCSECATENVDLWITSSSNKIEHQIASAINVTSTLSYQWTVDIDSSEIASSATWVFRFVASGMAGTTAEQISSPVFDIVESDVTATTTAQSTTTTATMQSSTISTTTQSTDQSATRSTASTTATTSSSNLTASTASTATIIDTSSALSLGDKAGIGIGAVGGTIILIAVGMAIVRRKKYNKEDAPFPLNSNGFPPPTPNMGHGGYGTSGTPISSEVGQYHSKEYYHMPPHASCISPYSPPPASYAGLHGYEQTSSPSELPHNPYDPRPSELGS